MVINYLGMGYYRMGEFIGVAKKFESKTNRVQLDTGLWIQLDISLTNQNCWLGSIAGLSAYFTNGINNRSSSKVNYSGQYEYTIKYIEDTVVHIYGGGQSVCIQLNEPWWFFSCAELIGLAINDFESVHPHTRKINFNKITSISEDSSFLDLAQAVEVMKSYQDFFGNFYFESQKEIDVLNANIGCDVRLQEAERALRKFIHNSQLRCEYFNKTNSRKLRVIELQEIDYD
ncbi:hypothetical protein A1QO_00670 [Vibrio genomosp. F10 str. ZF-129]|uniref:Uncharacterized protein n=1 Tax=Vibrio genomosp. F10 str. ZF-129 TaxID=1187848 RepID=A0A1E5BHA3_9VIBR|nr:hypothetical protein [Vibrio genomosp. F10]OEE35305.1 hypothetical protein A1QO_00670 [Vibrio genomosp. F10 str. ZF-129]